MSFSANNNYNYQQEEQEELPLAYHTNICVYIYIHITYIIGTYFPLIKVRWFTNNENKKTNKQTIKHTMRLLDMKRDIFEIYLTQWRVISLDANTYIVHKCTDVQIYQEYHIWYMVWYIYIRFPQLIVLQMIAICKLNILRKKSIWMHKKEMIESIMSVI